MTISPTSVEKLRLLSEAENYLRPGVILDGLEAIANQMSDNEFAERMVNARSNLFQLLLSLSLIIRLE